MPTTSKPRWRALVGLDYAGRRLEAGQEADDIPEDSLPWLLEQGLIAPAGAPQSEEGADGNARE